MKLLIIGGDAAGMSAASRAKRNMPDMEVTVLEQTADVSYSACGMPYNIADPHRDMNDLVVRKADAFREKQGIELLTGHRAEAIDADGGTVTAVTPQGKTAVFPYDHLILATGASPVFPDVPGRSLPGVMALKQLEDGRRIKEYIKSRQVASVLILGMGYVGLEMCEALRARGIQVAMVKPGPDLLPWMDRSLAQVVSEELAANEVALHTGQTVLEIREQGRRLSAVTAAGILEADMILSAMGIHPNSALATEAGISLGPENSIAVDKQLHTSRPHVFAAGDCADAYHVVTGQKTWIPLALRANRAGWAAADVVCGRGADIEGVAGTAVFKVFNLEVARTGLSMAEAHRAGFDPVSATIRSRSRAHAHPGATDLHVHVIGDRISGKLLGAQMVGREGAAHRINAAAVALHAGMSVERFSGMDLAYAPPFGPTWDPLLTAANQLVKQLRS